MNKNGLNQVEWVHDFMQRAEAQQNFFTNSRPGFFRPSFQHPPGRS